MYTQNVFKYENYRTKSTKNQPAISDDSCRDSVTDTRVWKFLLGQTRFLTTLPSPNLHQVEKFERCRVSKSCNTTSIDENGGMCSHCAWAAEILQSISDTRERFLRSQECLYAQYAISNRNVQRRNSVRIRVWTCRRSCATRRCA